MVRWWIARAGLFLSVFAVVALSGPGRIDIVDGQTRYEVARSRSSMATRLFEIPTSGSRCSRAVMASDTQVSLSASVFGMAAILAADCSGPVNEGRRHFFFTLIGAVASAVLAVIYASFFRRLGLGRELRCSGRRGVFFARRAGSMGPAPSMTSWDQRRWFSRVSTALACRRRHPCAGATVAGLALGLAFNCKEPLGIFVLPVLAAIYDPDLDWRSQWGRLAIIVSLLVLSVAIYLGYDLYKFPPGPLPATPRS